MLNSKHLAAQRGSSVLGTLRLYLKRRAPLLHRIVRNVVYKPFQAVFCRLRAFRWRSVSLSHYGFWILKAGARSPRANRSVVFLHNSYYHFYYLAQALRRRGWDAITVSLEDPHGPQALYYHG